ncbi:MAG TPA: L-2-hydroxyglutarate oxidase [Capillimicrobium sp.]|nr:L-2-hydroxyglutarate oxidase [Capillimicrobium sp.]
MADLPPDRCDVAVVGGGIVGLAVARELMRRHPAERIVVLEREDEIGAHQTGHNSGVVHAGIYYAPGSLKAKLCVAGAREMAELCEARGIPYERCGKLIVATAPSELGRLDELERRGRANGVPGLRRVDADGICELEPHATGIAALHSPATGIADFAAVARAFAGDVGSVYTGCGVEAVQPRERSIVLRHARGHLEARHAVFCAGAWSDRLAVLAGADPDPRIVPFRGAYLRLKPHRRHLVRSLIYPVPDPSLPFLGVHLTRHTSGDVLVGPTALLAPGRTAYRLSRFSPRDLAETLGWPGSWRMVRHWWRTGAIELRHAALRSAFVRAAARFVPDLTVDDVEPAFAGIRAQALGRDGRLVDDFVFSHTERALHVRNAPSPGATSSLAIGRHIADEVERIR